MMTLSWAANESGGCRSKSSCCCPGGSHHLTEQVDHQPPAGLFNITRVYVLFIRQGYYEGLLTYLNELTRWWRNVGTREREAQRGLEK